MALAHVSVPPYVACALCVRHGPAWRAAVNQWVMVTRRRIALFGVIALAGAGLVVGVPTPAKATTATDEATFRAAWTNPGETRIKLARNITLTCAGGGAAVRSSPTPLIVEGRRHRIAQACANNGVLEQAGVGALTLRNLTITRGRSTGTGGGIRTRGELMVTNGKITNNKAADYGGGIYGESAVTMTQSSVTDNSSRQGGGGVWVTGTLKVTDSTISGNEETGTFGGGGISATSSIASATINNSTIADNKAGITSGGIGGGGMAANGSWTITNSTITRNSAGSFGGGGIVISTTGQVNLVYSTVVENTSSGGANVRGTGGQLVSFASVVALPQGSGNCTTPVTTSNGFNLSDDASCAFTQATDRQSSGSPQVAALADNGGPTRTRLPQPSSPLIDAVLLPSCQDDGASGITTDQRGLGRPHASGCDIGAVEVH